MATTRDNMRYLSIVGDHQTDEIVDRVSQQCFLLAFPAHLLWSKIRRVTTMELTLSMKVKIYCKIVLKFSSGTAWSPAERWLMTANLVSSLRRIKNDFTIRKVVINRIFFGRQLFEKQFRKILDTRVLVLQAFGHLSKLTLDFLSLHSRSSASAPSAHSSWPGQHYPTGHDTAHVNFRRRCLRMRVRCRRVRWQRCSWLWHPSRFQGFWRGDKGFLRRTSSWCRVACQGRLWQYFVLIDPE